MLELKDVRVAYGNIEVLRGKSLEEIRERAEQTAKENNVKVAAIAE